MTGRVLKTAGQILLALLLWEFVGHFRLVADGALPAPSGIIAQYWQDRGVYPQHIWATLQPAMIGFCLGNAASVLLAFLFVLAPVTERLLRGFNIAVFAIPPIALSPILVITLPGDWPQIILASVLVYFPTMIMTWLGLRDVDPRLMDVIRVYGGGQFSLLQFLRLRSCLPGLLGGLRVAAPAAILGAILAEFGSGPRWGLGSFLLGSIGEGDPNRIWGIGLAATGVAAVAYAFCAVLGRIFTATITPVTIASGRIEAATAKTVVQHAANFAFSLAAAAAPFLIWWGILAGFGVSPVIADTPLGVWHYLFNNMGAADNRTEILQALQQSLPMAGIGLFIALGFALGLAVMGTIWRKLIALVMPAALVLQTMPLVALTPIIVLIFGRGFTTTLVVTITVSFFPAFITIAQGLAQVPKPALDLLDVYGAGRLQKLLMVSLPASLPYLCTAARLVAPASLLGVMTAEWLATGYGLGNLLNEARGMLDYGMIWSVAFVSVALSVGFYQLVRLVELTALRRYRTV